MIANDVHYHTKKLVLGSHRVDEGWSNGQVEINGLLHDRIEKTLQPQSPGRIE